MDTAHALTKSTGVALSVELVVEREGEGWSKSRAKAFLGITINEISGSISGTNCANSSLKL
jgi:hypothetical protein